MIVKNPDTDVYEAITFREHYYGGCPEEMLEARAEARSSRIADDYYELFCN